MVRLDESQRAILSYFERRISYSYLSISDLVDGFKRQYNEREIHYRLENLYLLGFLEMKTGVFVKLKEHQ